MKNIKIAEEKKKFKKNIAGIGLISIIVGSVILATLVAGGTKWLVSMQQATISNEDRMTAMSLAYNKWQEYAAKSYDNVNSEAKRTTTNDRFDIDSTVGGEHQLDGGGFSKPVTITVYKAGTTKVAYAMVAEKVKGILTFEDEIDRLEKEINSLSDRLTNAINNINDKDAQQDAEIAALKAEIAALKAQIANIQSQIDSLNSRVSNDESNTASKIAELQNLLNELNAKLTELSSQVRDGKDGDTIQVKVNTLTFYVEIRTDTTMTSYGPRYHYFTTGTVQVILSGDVNVYSNGSNAKIKLATIPANLDSTTIALGTSIDCEGSSDYVRNHAIDYVNQHIDYFKSEIVQKIPEASKATRIIVDTTGGW